MAKHLTPQTIDALINQALAVEDEQAQEAGALGFMARAMVQATLPHSKVAGNEFTRVNGNYSLSIMAPSSIGLPYGTIPRLLLAWLTTEAVKVDKYGRKVGKVLLAGLDCNLEQVKRGLAWHYKQYQREQSPTDQQSYAAAEIEARAAKLGLWRDAEPVAPWDFRHARQR
jgi:Staphylococcal nuclease homologue